MLLFQWTLALLLGAVVLTGLARRVGAPYPAFLALGGAMLSLVPGAPRLILDPDLALALFIAPVLLDAAYDISWRDLRANWIAVGQLVLGAVAATTAAVALVLHAMVPGMGWAAAIAVGAIVAPPDAAAAGAVLRSARLPHRLLVILEGESLLNDASALLVYRLAVGAALAGGTSPAGMLPAALLMLAGSLLLGWAASWVSTRLMGLIRDPSSSIVMQFVNTFGIWLLADRLGASSILTIVTFAILVSHRPGRSMTASLRVPSYAVWVAAVFLLNILAFALIGLNVGPILQGLDPAQRGTYALAAGAVLATVIGVRLVWMMGFISVKGWHQRRRGGPPPTARAGVIAGWCGMRGLVTLAAAFALPAGFPHRDLAVVTAFAVVLGTLVLQGLTLRPLIAWLHLEDDTPVEREVRLARAEAARAALASLDGDASEAADALRTEYAAALGDGERAEGGDGRALAVEDLRRRALDAQRDVLDDLRRREVIGDDAYHRVEEELDRVELTTLPVTA